MTSLIRSFDVINDSLNERIFDVSNLITDSIEGRIYESVWENVFYPLLAKHKIVEETPSYIHMMHPNPWNSIRTPVDKSVANTQDVIYDKILDYNYETPTN